MFYLMDANLKLLKVTESLEACFYWADILLPTSDYRVDDFTLQGLLKFQKSELLQCYTATTGDKVRSHVEPSTLAGLLLNKMQDLLDSTPIPELHGRLGRSPSQPSVKALPQGEPQAQRAPRAASAASGAKVAGRPKPGTTTGLIWEVADSLQGPVTSKALLEHPSLAGVNRSTVLVQFSHWRRHQENL